jgi:hypothetical protein
VGPTTGGRQEHVVEGVFRRRSDSQNAEKGAIIRITMVYGEDSIEYIMLSNRRLSRIFENDRFERRWNLTYEDVDLFLEDGQELPPLQNETAETFNLQDRDRIIVIQKLPREDAVMTESGSEEFAQATNPECSGKGVRGFEDEEVKGWLESSDGESREVSEANTGNQVPIVDSDRHGEEEVKYMKDVKDDDKSREKGASKKVSTIDGGIKDWRKERNNRRNSDHDKKYEEVEVTKGLTHASKGAQNTSNMESEIEEKKDNNKNKMLDGIIYSL